MEEIIGRVRTLIGFGLTLDECITTCSDLEPHDVYLAYHAANLLEKYEEEEYERRADDRAART